MIGDAANDAGKVICILLLVFVVFALFGLWKIIEPIITVIGDFINGVGDFFGGAIGSIGDFFGGVGDFFTGGGEKTEAPQVCGLQVLTVTDFVQDPSGVLISGPGGRDLVCAD